MGGTGNPGIRRLKRLARGESTAVVMGMAGGILLAAVMWRSSASSHREAVAAPRPEAFDAMPGRAVADDKRATPAVSVTPATTDAEMAETVAELEALPDASATPRETDHAEVAVTATLPSDPHPRAAYSVPKTTPSSPSRNEPTGDATLSFWNAINDVIAREAAMRIAPANLTAANAGGFVEARIRAGKFAGDALRNLPRENVDRDVLAHAADLAAWYDDEARLAGEASSLLGSSDFAARRGSAGKSWRNSEDKHRQRCDEINRRSATLQTQLSQKFGRQFPPLQ